MAPPTRTDSSPGAAHAAALPDSAAEEPAPPARGRAPDLKKEGNELVVMGLGVGALGVAGATLLGAACPLCVVAAPALIGAGALRHWQARRRKQSEPRPDAPESADEAVPLRPARDHGDPSL